MSRYLRLAALMMVLGTAATAEPQQTPTRVNPADSASCPVRQVTICVSDAYQTVISQSSLSPSNRRSNPDTVRALGAEIIFTSSDMLVSWHPSPANKICAGSGCIYYYKSCDVSRCNYEYGNPAPAYGPGMVPLGHDVLYPGKMSINFRTPEALRVAEQNIFLALGPDGDKTFVPLSEVTMGSDGWTKICARASADSGC